jgi:synaptojanin
LANTENVFWFGDFNYRIDVDNNFARTKIQQKDYQELWKNDQLQICMRQGLVFPGFQEGELHFDPTYKYDNGTHTYDSSEKERIPAWTDRVLFSGNAIELLEYNRGEQLMSDHRPGNYILT